MSGKRQISERQYYDKPDGQDLVGKLMYTNKWAAAVGAAAATTDVLMVSHTKGYLNTLGRYIFFIGPTCGIASAFTFGTYISTRLREKDDTYNYFVGSFGAAGVLGAWTRNAKLGLFAGGVFCLASWVKRLSIEEGWEFFPEYPRGWGTFRSFKHDWSLVAEREKGWTTKE